MEAIITDIQPETQTISSFRLQPASEVKYQPGQWLYVRLTPDLRHHFTLSSSPTEKFLQFTTQFRQQSAYKQHLWQLQAGDRVEIAGPFGSFTLEDSDVRPRIFIAGGIGITPFRSMIRYCADRQLSLPMTLLYSNKDKAQAAFVPELESISIAGLKIVIIETEKTGRLNQEKLKQYCPDTQASTIWLCGPPTLVEAFTNIAHSLEFPPENIKSEEFTGY